MKINSLCKFFEEDSDLIAILERKISNSEIRKITINELKEKLLFPNCVEDFDILADTSEINNDETIILLTLPEKQIHKLNKIYYYTTLKNYLNKVFLERDYMKKEKSTLLLSSAYNLYNLYNLYKENPSKEINIIEIDDDETMEEINVFFMNKLHTILKKNINC